MYSLLTPNGDDPIGAVSTSAEVRCPFRVEHAIDADSLVKYQIAPQ
jgi:hypothetical protein